MTREIYTRNEVWVLAAQFDAHATTEWGCTAFLPRGTPERCDTPTDLLVHVEATGFNEPTCRTHVPAVHAAALLLFGEATVMHRTLTQVTKKALVRVAPDALPLPCLRSSNCNLADKHDGDCNLVY